MVHIQRGDALEIAVYVLPDCHSTAANESTSAPLSMGLAVGEARADEINQHARSSMGSRSKENDERERERVRFEEGRRREFD
jgi:hypothetical protein